VIYRELAIEGGAGPEQKIEIVVAESGRIIFGRCGCPHFQENALNKGPCEHMLALLLATDLSIADLPTSRPEPTAALDREAEP
jgi:hypothetical protein